MPEIPSGDGAPLIRTDFSNDGAWDALVGAATATSDDGFIANLTILNDVAFEDINPTLMEELATQSEHAVIFVADARTLRNIEQPVLCIDTEIKGRSFRAVPRVLWSIENNLSLANMDFDEFVDALDENGIYRGFD